MPTTVAGNPLYVGFRVGKPKYSVLNCLESITNSGLDFTIMKLFSESTDGTSISVDKTIYDPLISSSHWKDVIVDVIINKSFSITKEILAQQYELCNYIGVRECMLTVPSTICITDLKKLLKIYSKQVRVVVNYVLEYNSAAIDCAVVHKSLVDMSHTGLAFTVPASYNDHSQLIALEPSIIIFTDCSTWNDENLLNILNAYGQHSIGIVFDGINQNSSCKFLSKATPGLNSGAYPICTIPGIISSLYNRPITHSLLSCSINAAADVSYPSEVFKESNHEFYGSSISEVSVLSPASTSASSRTPSVYESSRDPVEIYNSLPTIARDRSANLLVSNVPTRDPSAGSSQSRDLVYSPIRPRLASIRNVSTQNERSNSGERNRTSSLLSHYNDSSEGTLRNVHVDSCPSTVSRFQGSAIQQNINTIRDNSIDSRSTIIRSISNEIMSNIGYPDTQENFYNDDEKILCSVDICNDNKLPEINDDVIVQSDIKMDESVILYMNYFKNRLTRLAQKIPVKPFIADLQPFQDYAQYQLDPLNRNLQSCTYEVFENDRPKYRQYRYAIAEYLFDKYINPNSRQESTEVMIYLLGAGRGGIAIEILRVLKSALKRRPELQPVLTVIEKNQQAANMLRWRIKSDPQWKDVILVEGDMREYVPSTRVDLVVSELLGSFSCNELSPECLEPWNTRLSPHGSMIPQFYAAYAAPVTASLAHDRMYNDREVPLPVGVVLLHQYRLIAPPQPVFMFSHNATGSQIIKALTTAGNIDYSKQLWPAHEANLGTFSFANINDDKEILDYVVPNLVIDEGSDDEMLENILGYPTPPIRTKPRAPFTSPHPLIKAAKESLKKSINSEDWTTLSDDSHMADPELATLFKNLLGKQLHQQFRGSLWPVKESEENNNVFLQERTLRFPAPEKPELITGFAGYLFARLYGEHTLSTLPDQPTPDMFSWFDYYFACDKQLITNRPYEIVFKRCKYSQHVNYTWQYVNPLGLEENNERDYRQVVFPLSCSDQ